MIKKTREMDFSQGAGSSQAGAGRSMIVPQVDHLFKVA